MEKTFSFDLWFNWSEDSLSLLFFIELWRTYQKFQFFWCSILKPLVLIQEFIGSRFFNLTISNLVGFNVYPSRWTSLSILGIFTWISKSGNQSKHFNTKYLIARDYYKEKKLRLSMSRQILWWQIPRIRSCRLKFIKLMSRTCPLCAQPWYSNSYFNIVISVFETILLVHLNKWCIN